MEHRMLQKSGAKRESLRRGSYSRVLRRALWMFLGLCDEQHPKECQKLGFVGNLLSITVLLSVMWLMHAILGGPAAAILIPLCILAVFFCFSGDILRR